MTITVSRNQSIVLAATDVAMHLQGPKETMQRNQHLSLMRHIKVQNPALYAALIQLQKVTTHA
jgi:hypothetical protein